MASPGDPSDPTGASEGAFAAAEFSADDFERVSTAFRPSWEFDQAPFTGPSSLSASDIRALHGGEVNADVRATIASVRSVNGSHPPPKATVTSEPAESVIVDPVGAPASVKPPASAPPRPVPVAIEFPQAQPVAATERKSVGPRAYVPATPARPPLPSIDIDSPFRRKSKTPLLVGLGVAAAGVVGVVVWMSSGSPSEAPPAAATQPTASAVAVPAAEPPPPAPAPPPPPVASIAAEAPPAPPPVNAAPAIPPSPAPLPVPAPTTRNAVSSPAQKPQSSAAAPKTSKPKGPAPTIVRDVPF